MIRGGFLSANDRRALIRLARDGLEEHRVARRANAIVLLDQGWSCERVAEALLLDDDTVRDWHRAFERGGIEALKSFGHEGGSSRLTDEQAMALADWVDAHRPRSIRKIGAWLRRTLALSYSRSGLIALLHRLGFDYRKPEAMPRGLDDAQQQAFIDRYEPALCGDLTILAGRWGRLVDLGRVWTCWFRSGFGPGFWSEGVCGLKGEL